MWPKVVVMHFYCMFKCFNSCQSPISIYSYCALTVLFCFRKKAEILDSQKDCGIIEQWLTSIVNHLHCSASSSARAANYGDVVSAKWQSLSNHIQNIYTGHNEQFPNCLYDTLTRKWL